VERDKNPILRYLCIDLWFMTQVDCNKPHVGLTLCRSLGCIDDKMTQDGIAGNCIQILETNYYFKDNDK
jgi:hypothetical protein